MAVHRRLTSFQPSQPQTSTFKLLFIRRDPSYRVEKPFYYSGTLPAGNEDQRTNIVYEEHADISITNLRASGQKPDLERNGFEIMRWPTGTAIAELRAKAQDEYMSETCALVKEHLEADVVLCYNCRFRSSKTDTAGDTGQVEIPQSNAERVDEPAETPHIDQSKDGAWRRCRRHMTDEEVSKYLNGTHRVRILNGWRPLVTVERDHLALCDHTTVGPEEIIAVDRVSDDYIGEVYYLHYNEVQRWFWYDRQEPEELTLFVSFDSHPGEGAPYCPHACFTGLPGSKGSACPPPRHSVEVRLIVLTKLEEALVEKT